MTIAKRMLDAFEGSDLGYLVTRVGDKGKKGKTEAQYRTVMGQVTEDLMQKHIDGVSGIGIVPIKVDKCKFGVIDIDDYGLDHKILQSNIQRLKLPLVHCRSKSGGAHLYLFFKDWESCALVREQLEEIRAALGFSGSGELFPAQELIKEAEDGVTYVGNGINIPYFNAELPTRYAYDSNLESLELEEFLDLVEKSRVSMAAVSEIDLGGGKSVFSDAAFCLDMITREGKVEENRNITMFNIGVFCRLAWPDDWKSQLEEFNRTVCDPPLPASEIVALQRSLDSKKGYHYQCSVSPLKEHCNKVKCKMRQFGIGPAVEDQPEIGGLTIMLAEPRKYFMNLDGKTVTLKGQELQNPHLWQLACMEQLDMMPAKPSPKDWQQLINALLKTASKQEVPRELTWTGKFENLLRDFCTSHVRAVAPEEVLLGKPWTDKGRSNFKIEALEKFLRNNDFRFDDTGTLHNAIRKMGGENGKLNYYNDEGVRRDTRVWWVPEFEDNTEVQVEIKEDKFDIPF
jgi:hypothetical protein